MKITIEQGLEKTVIETDGDKMVSISCGGSHNGWPYSTTHRLDGVQYRDKNMDWDAWEKEAQDNLDEGLQK